MALKHTTGQNTLLTEKDFAILGAKGITRDELNRQANLFLKRPPHIEVVRACKVGDGIEQHAADSASRLGELAHKAIGDGRVTDFVPASGAATRMFKDLARYAQRESLYRLSYADLSAFAQASVDKSNDDAVADKEAATQAIKFFDGLAHFPFFAQLRSVVAAATTNRVDLQNIDPKDLFESEDGKLVVNLVLDSAYFGLGYKSMPKALIPCHKSPEGQAVTPLEEHLETSAQFGKDALGRCRLHFTISPEHEDAFRKLLDEAKVRIGKKYSVEFDVTISFQKPGTDTIAVTSEGKVLRDNSGTPITGQSGHGALLTNLADIGGDIIYLNNIDNVHPDSRRKPFLGAKTLLLGRLVEAQNTIRTTLLKIDAFEAGSEAYTSDSVDGLKEVVESLGVSFEGRGWNAASLPERLKMLRGAINRPVRVVGVVKNTGEPGGGPNFIKKADGTVGKAIVEKSEFDATKPEQIGIFRDASHFSPVEIMCGVRDYKGQSFDLISYANQSRVFFPTKTDTATGIQITKLERPGLWNGSMEEWLTIFVEVPLEAFAPVKTVTDLLKDGHQPALDA